VIDEFQYLGKANKSFPSVLQKIWDVVLKDANVMLVLCGSLISLMKKQTLSYNSPLYGRRTSQIRIRQIPFAHYAGFSPRKSRKDLIEYYSVTGGVPKYIEMFKGERSVYSAIKKNILSSGSFLYEEPVFLLKNEVSEIGSYFSLIRVIANGNRKLSDISAAVGVKQTSMTGYLKTLIELDIIEREVPVTEMNPEKSKMGLYRIKDHFIEFWFKFVYPFGGQIETGNIDEVYNRIRRSFIDRHVSFVYEEISRERIDSLCKEKKLPVSFDRVGSWWRGDVQIDVCAVNKDKKVILLGECKYRNSKMDTDVYYALREKAAKVTWERQSRREIFAFFSISGFTDRFKALANEQKDVFLFD
jgi:AAA+ ATPase superfamily predicted ATPase